MSLLKTAQKRLASFMKKENASFANCAKILLIDESNLSLFMAQKSGSSSYTENILKVLDAKNKSRNIKKLSSSATGSRKHIQGLSDRAMAALDAFIKQHGFTYEEASTKLGWGKSNVYQLKWLHGKNKIGERAAKNILDAINHYEAARAAASQTNCRTIIVPEATLDDTSNITKEDIASDRQSRDKSNSSTFEEAEEPTPTSDDMREILSTHFETQTGYSIREIQESANEIDLILSAKRVGATVRITADLSVGSLK